MLTWMQRPKRTFHSQPMSAYGGQADVGGRRIFKLCLWRVQSSGILHAVPAVWESSKWLLVSIHLITYQILNFFFRSRPRPHRLIDLCCLDRCGWLAKIGTYNYLEIGSYRGGSLTPFLMDPACKMILSIDDRGRVLPDERGISFDYTGITTQSMLDDLNHCGITTDKLRTFDGSIRTLIDDYTASFDLAFIDGEHTDEACFRDFLWALPLVKPNSIVIFHDSA